MVQGFGLRPKQALVLHASITFDQTQVSNSAARQLSLPAQVSLLEPAGANPCPECRGWTGCANVALRGQASRINNACYAMVPLGSHRLRDILQRYLTPHNSRKADSVGGKV